MENDKKILALLLSSAWFSSSNIYGDASDSQYQTNNEALHEKAQQQVVLQRQATFNSITEILNTNPTYKNKPQSEKDRFAALYTAIVLSAPEASKTLTVKNDAETPKLEPTVAAGLSKALTQVLTSFRADKIWNDSVSQTTPTKNLLYNALNLKKSIKLNSRSTLKSSAITIETRPPSAPVATPVVAPAAPITHLIYTGQDLSQYPNLVSISITVDQLRGGTDITSTKSLEITVTGDAANAPLSTQRLVMPNAKIDLSAVTNLTGLTVERADTTSAKLPNTVTSLTVGTTTQVTGATALTTLKLTGAAPVPTWATNGSITAANATLDLSAVTGTTLDLTGLNTDITGLIINAGLQPTNISNRLTSLKLTGAAPVPGFATDGSLTTTNATLDLSAVTGLPATLDLSGLSADITTVIFPTSNTQNITHIVLPQTVNTIQNLPTTVTHLTANVPAFASIGAYNSDWDAISTFPTHITHLTVVDSITTSIGNYFFSRCTGLTNVNLSGLTNIQTIGQDFFYGCTGLTDVNLSGLTAVQTIGNFFFYNCTGLTNVNLSGLTAVQTIGYYFFSNCIKLTSIDLSALSKLTSIGPYFFGGCSGLTDVNLSGLTSVTSIGGWFFMDCTGLNTLIAKANTGINGTLLDTTVNAITGVTSDTGYLKDKLTRINLTGNATSLPAWVNNTLMTAANATLDLSAMTQVTTASITNTDITGLIINAGLQPTGISNRLTSLKLTGNATSLPAWATDGSLTAANATLDLSAMTGLPATLNLTGLNADITNLILPETVTAIQNLPTTVTSLTVGTTTQVTGATALTTLNLTGAAPVPGFATDGSLTAANATLNLSAMTGLPATLDLSGLSADITTVIFPTSNTQNITHIVLPQTVNTIQNLPTTVTHLTANVSALASIGAYRTPGTRLQFPTRITHVTIVDSNTTSIGNNFFLDCTGLTNVDLSGLTAVTSIDGLFFRGCTGLTNVNLSGLTAVKSIGPDFFYGCTRLTSVNLSALTALETIGEGFFYGCTGLTNVNLSGLTSVTSIGGRFFMDCTGLTSVDLSGLTALETIGQDFFYKCTGLTSVDLSGLTAVTSVNLSFFNNTPSLVTLTAKANTGINGTLSPATVTADTGYLKDKFTRINLIGNATSLPAWVNNTSMTATNATLDLSAMTGLSSPFSFATITNAEIKTLILPSGVTQSNTTGWTNTSGTTWTR